MAESQGHTSFPSCSGSTSTRRPVRIRKTLLDVSNILDYLDESDIDLSSDEEEEWFRDEKEEESLSSSSSDEDEDVPLSELQEKLNSNKEQVEWDRKYVFSPDSVSSSYTYMPSEERLAWKPLQYFKLYFDESFYELVSLETNGRTVRDSGKSLNVNSREIKTFMAVSIVMGTLKFPRLRMFWQSNFAVSIVSESIPRNRYFKIRNNIKLVNDLEVSAEVKSSDRVWKMRPMIKRLQERCHQLPRTTSLCVDEQMVPFTGRCTFKQHVPGKPHPVGLKNFVLATPSGLIVNFDIYQGKGRLLSASADKDADGMGVGAAAVIFLVEILNPGHSIYIDRFFTNIPLLQHLLKKGHTTTGTMMINRLPKSVVLKSDKLLRKTGRGSSDKIVHKDGKVVLVKWLDKKGVTMASTIHGVEPTDRCTRWSKKDREYIEVPRPLCIKEYNDKMGGVDLHDRMLSFYPMRNSNAL